MNTLLIMKQTALITGATSGIGEVIAKHLVQKGYTLIVLGRSKHKLDALKKSLLSINSNAQIDLFECDLSSFASVQQACSNVNTSYQSIDLLILNAGLWNFKFVETIDKIEETLQVNLLAPIYMFNAFRSKLIKGESSRVLFTSSGLHQGEINFSDLEFRKKFSGFKAYRQSKLGLILITRWLAKQSEYSKIAFFSIHPGMVNTKLGRNAGWLSRNIFKLFGKSPEKGARTHLYLIEENLSKLSSGDYYANSKLARTHAYSYDMKIAERLWQEVNTKMPKLSE